ncbi:MAG: hypothetical protein K1X78_23230 [Verrucomicrobiaceae bacterium]|nr:hypothetical protein [Verrucomicrobiaceae bacterium]
MKSLIPLSVVFVSTLACAQLPAGSFSRLIFSDEFAADGFGKSWGHYKSSSVVKDGVLHGITAPESDHPAVDVIRIAPERDLEVAVKFQFASEQAKTFNVWLDDKDYKGSHAGHICSITVSPAAVTVADAKTGTFSNEIYEKKKAVPPTLTDVDKANLQKWTKSVPNKVTLKDWHTLVVRTQADVVETTIDGKVVSSFQSPGVAHDHKTVVSLTTNRVDVNYDDFSIKGVAKP